jgi:thioredoxin-like negative regulator of GroEL
VKDYPENIAAWGNLAVVRESEGRRDEARQLLIEAIRQNPGPESIRMAHDALAAAHDEEGIVIIEKNRPRR